MLNVSTAPVHMLTVVVGRLQHTSQKYVTVLLLSLLVVQKIW